MVEFLLNSLELKFEFESTWFRFYISNLSGHVLFAKRAVKYTHQTGRANYECHNNDVLYNNLLLRSLNSKTSMEYVMKSFNRNTAKNEFPYFIYIILFLFDLNRKLLIISSPNRRLLWGLRRPSYIDLEGQNLASKLVTDGLLQTWTFQRFVPKDWHIFGLKSFGPISQFLNLEFLIS